MKSCPYFSFRSGCGCRHCRGICKCERRSRRRFVDVRDNEVFNTPEKLHV